MCRQTTRSNCAAGEFQLERIALLEPHARRQRRIAPARIGDRAFQDVDAHELGVGVARREPRGDLTAAAADIGDAGGRRQRVALEQLLLLRPDRLGLRGQVAQHRLVGHLLGLGIALFHGASGRESVRCNLSGRVSVPEGRTSRQRGISMSVRFVALLASTLGVCLVACSFAAQAAEKRLDRTFSVAPGGRLTIESEGSDLRVEGTAGNQVVVHILVSGSERAVERMTLSADQSGNDVAVVTKHGSGKWTDWLGGWNLDGKIEVQVPRDYNIDIRTSGGDITVGQLNGNARGRTSGGDIRLTDIHGPVDMQTSGGDVRVEQVEGQTRLNTSGGDIEVVRLNGDLDAKTSGGYIHLDDIVGKVDGAHVERQRHRPRRPRRFGPEDLGRRHPRHDRRQDRGPHVRRRRHCGAGRRESRHFRVELRRRPHRAGAEGHDRRAQCRDQRRLGPHRAAGHDDGNGRAQADWHHQRRRQPDPRAHVGRQHQGGRRRVDAGQPESAG